MGVELLDKKKENLTQSLITSFALLGMTVCICLLIILNFIIVPVEGISMLNTIYATLPDPVTKEADKAYAFLYKTTNVGYNDIIIIKTGKKIPDRNKDGTVKLNRNGTIILIDETIIKRVIGLPGDTVSVELYKTAAETGGTEDIYCLKINGEWIEEQYIYEPMTEISACEPIKVKAGQIFVMGDNREVSRDSRYEGPFPQSQIVGKAIAVYDQKHFIQFFFRGFEHKALVNNE